MKRGFLIVFLFLFVAFAAVTLMKNAPRSNASQLAGKEPGIEQAKKSERVLFWDYYNRATQYRIGNNAPAAVNYYRQALKINPSHENALYYLGNMQMILERYGEARKTWNHLLEINPLSARSHSQLGFLYCCNNTGNKLYDLEQAYHHFNRAALLNREETGPMLQLAKIDLIRGRTDEARNRLDAIIRSNFRSVEAYFMRGYLAWSQGHIGQSHELLSKASTLHTGTDPKSENVGEGATNSGDNAMLSEALRCSFLTDRIEEWTPTVSVSELMITEIYTRFKQELQRY